MKKGIFDRVSKIGKSISETAGELKDKAEDLVDEGREKVGDLSTSVFKNDDPATETGVIVETFISTEEQNIETQIADRLNELWDNMTSVEIESSFVRGQSVTLIIKVVG